MTRGRTGNDSVVIRRLVVGASLVAVAGVAPGAGAGPRTDFVYDCSPPNCAITIKDNPQVVATSDEPATPYPATIQMFGIEGSNLGVKVTISGFTHGFADDVDILIVNPAGHAVELMSDVGGNDAPTSLSLTFSDTASQSLPDSNGIASGTWKPSNYVGGEASCQNELPGEPTTDVFPSPAPAAPMGGYGQALSVFNADSSANNGGWNLFVGDDCGGSGGSIASWSIAVNGATAVRVYGLRGIRKPDGVRLSWRTGTDVGLAGFNLVRTRGGRPGKANRGLIRVASTSASGSRYTFVDRGAKASHPYAYRLEAVSLTGARSTVAGVFVR